MTALKMINSFTINILFCLAFIFLLSCKADVDVTYYPAMIDIDTKFGTNYYTSFGDPAVACNCSDNGGTPYPCLWTDGINGFKCTGIGINATITSFKYISLSSASGILPSSLGAISSLKTIQIQFVNISGTLPNEIFSLSSLKTLIITDTDLTGNIPSSISLTSLTMMYLYNNKFNSILPSGFPLSLTSLKLDNNQLNGTIDVLNSLTSLTVLTLANNYFFGDLPSFLSNFPLFSLDLSNNYFTGNIPSLQVSFYNCYMMNMSLPECKGSSICQVSCRPLCSLPAPNDTICVNDTWVYIGDYVNPNILTLNSPLIIQGNIYMNSSTVIIVRNISTYAITVNGTVYLNGTLIVSGNIGDLIPIISAENITGNFTIVNVDESCIKAKPQQTLATYQILLIFDDSCNQKIATSTSNKIRIIIGSVIGGIIFISVIGLLIGIFISQRSKLFCLFNSNEGGNFVT
jgi:hypothetical protein